MNQDIPHAHLIEQLQQGDKNALEKIYDAYSGMVYGTILRIVINEAVSQELVQDVFLKVWTNIQQYNPEKGRLSTWIMNIARNRAIDELRSKAHKNQSENRDLENSVSEVNKVRSFQPNVDTLDVKGFGKYLRPEQRLLIDYIYFKGYTHEEAARELSIPLGTVKTRLRNSILELRKVLKVEQ